MEHSTESKQVVREKRKLPEVNGETPSKLKKRQNRLRKKKKKNQDTANEGDIEKGKPSLEYLDVWKGARPLWKFQKVRQSYLLQNIYDRKKVPKKHFKILLEYLEELKGNSRTKTLMDAQSILKEWDNLNEEDRTDKERKRKHRRACSIVAVLS